MQQLFSYPVAWRTRPFRCTIFPYRLYYGGIVPRSQNPAHCVPLNAAPRFRRYENFILHMQHTTSLNLMPNYLSATRVEYAEHHNYRIECGHAWFVHQKLNAGWGSGGRGDSHSAPARVRIWSPPTAVQHTRTATPNNGQGGAFRVRHNDSETIDLDPQHSQVIVLR
jgi:hypothetical protein